jgi:hypothetical protein
LYECYSREAGGLAGKSFGANQFLAAKIGNFALAKTKAMAYICGTKDWE